MSRGQNLLNKVYNKPLLITMDDLQPIADYLSNPERVASLRFEQDTTELPKLESFDYEEQYKKAMMSHLDINPNTLTGVLNIDGVLVNREGQMNAQCVELTSYQGLKKRFEMQIEQGMKSCVLMISSGGGEAFGAWSTANYVKKLAQQNNVKLTTYINGSACSAAYVWAVVSDEIVSHPMGSCGSIGVVVQLYNDSKMLENMGVERTFVYAGGNKIPFDKDGNFSEKFISDLQSSVDKTYMKFVQHVVDNRLLTSEQVVETNASVFDSEDALKLGLIDKVMELEDFEVLYGLKTVQSDGNGILLEMPEHSKNQLKEDGMSKENDVVLTVEQLQEQLTSELAAKQKLADQLAKANEQLGELAGIKEQLTTLQEAHTKLLGEVAEKEHQSKLDARQAKLEAALGKDNEQVATLLASTESLEDAAFDVIAQSLSASVEKKQEQLKEIGGEGQQSDTQLSLGELIAKKVTPRK